jgi:hypothetical protein
MPAGAERDAEQLLGSVVGCDPGTIDGAWGAKAKSALADFARHAKRRISVEAPSEAALDQRLNAKERVCPRVCEAGSVDKGGRCLALERGHGLGIGFAHLWRRAVGQLIGGQCARTARRRGSC